MSQFFFNHAVNFCMMYYKESPVDIARAVGW